GLCLSLASIYTFSMAKNQDFKHSNLQISAGWAFPQGHFSKPTLPTFQALNGADRGLSCNIAYTYYVARWIGFGVLFDYSNYKTDTVGLRNILSNPNILVNELTANRWNNYSAKASLNFRIPLILGLSITARGTVGYAWQTSPEIVIDSKVDNTYIRNTIPKNKAGNLTYGAGAGILWKILGPLTLSANFDYNWALPFKFKGNTIKEVVNGAESQIKNMGDFKQNYQGISFVLGIGFTF
ncbi:MAG: hypothetical protein RR190_07610, partial [Bacteroidales bacterium]